MPGLGGRPRIRLRVVAGRTWGLSIWPFGVAVLGLRVRMDQVTSAALTTVGVEVN